MELSVFTIAQLKRDMPRVEYFEISPTWRERLPGRVGPSGQFMRTALAGARSVLDVGAGDRYYQQVLTNLGITASYTSVDNDERSAQHNYSDFLSVSAKFDAILMLELIEHVTPELGIQFLKHAHSLLNHGGVLVVSTPNAHHPSHVWRASVTHVRPWPMDDLYGALRYAGFGTVRLARQYTVSPKRKIICPLTKLLHNLMELDHAQTTFAAAWNNRATGT